MDAEDAPHTHTQHTQTQTQTQTQSQQYTEEDDFSQEPRHTPWGRLVPCPHHHQNLNTSRRLGMIQRTRPPVHNLTQIYDIYDEEFKVGRSDECNLSFKPKDIRDDLMRNISKKHFSISRDLSDPYAPVIIHDFSYNGTYLNGQIIGKGKKQVLEHEDQIALTHHSVKIFIFMDCIVNKPDIFIPEQIVKKYSISRTIGKGACGVVKLIYDKTTAKKYAIKIVAKQNLNNGQKIPFSDPKKIMNEVHILKSINHPFVISTREIVSSQSAVFMIMEFMEGGELFDKIQRSGRIAEQDTKIIFRQLVLAVKYLHDQGIAHRDLKPENVLLYSPSEMLVKVTDFGLSKLIGEESFMKTMCGTPLYVAPEVLLAEGINSYGSQVDIWSLGVILFVCLSGYLPFSPEYEKLSLREQIIGGKFAFSRSHWAGVSLPARELVLKMLKVDCKRRITLDKILKDKWMMDEEVIAKVDELMKMSVSNASKDEIKKVEFSVVKRVLSETTREEQSPPSKRQKLEHSETSSLRSNDDDELSVEKLSFN